MEQLMDFLVGHYKETQAKRSYIRFLRYEMALRFFISKSSEYALLKLVNHSQKYSNNNMWLTHLAMWQVIEIVPP